MKHDNTNKTTHGGREFSTFEWVNQYSDAAPMHAFGILNTLSKRVEHETDEGETSLAFDFLLKVADEGACWKKGEYINGGLVFESSGMLRASSRQIINRYITRTLLSASRDNKSCLACARKLVNFYSKNPEHVKGHAGDENIIKKFLERYRKKLGGLHFPNHEAVLACCYTSQWNLIARDDKDSLQEFIRYTTGLLVINGITKSELEEILSESDDHCSDVISIFLFKHGLTDIASFLFELQLPFRS